MTYRSVQGQGPRKVGLSRVARIFSGEAEPRRPFYEEPMWGGQGWGDDVRVAIMRQSRHSRQSAEPFTFAPKRGQFNRGHIPEGATWNPTRDTFTYEGVEYWVVAPSLSSLRRDEATTTT